MSDTLGRKLQKAMDERGLSLRALARELGVAVGTAEGWLKGWRTPEIRHITNIAVFLRVDPSEVLDWELVGWYPEGTAVLVMMYTAARNSECASLAWPNFTPQMDWVKIHGKHNKIRVVPVHPRLRLELRPHVGAYPYVFPGERGRSHVHTATVSNWVAEVCDAAGIRRATPHQLRHTSIATMNDATGDLRTAQEFAGHSRPETTAIYTRTTAQKLTDAALFSFDWLDGV